MAALAFERLQQMHLAARSLTGGGLWILKGFQREVIHNFDCISSSWRDAVHTFCNSVNGPLFLIYTRIFPPLLIIYIDFITLLESLSKMITIGEAIGKNKYRPIIFLKSRAARSCSVSGFLFFFFLWNVSKLNKAAPGWPGLRSMTERLALFPAHLQPETRAAKRPVAVRP